MADGHVNKCKECNKNDVRKNRASNVDYYRDYDIKRGCRVPYEKVVTLRKKYPKVYFAHTLVQNELRKGSISKLPCEVCGAEKVHAHHDDYDFPLSVRWLCPVHHRAWHDENGEGKNKK